MCNKTYDSKTCCDGQAAILLRDEVRPWSGGLDGLVEPGFHVSVHDQDNDQTIIEQSSTENYASLSDRQWSIGLAGLVAPCLPVSV